MQTRLRLFLAGCALLAGGAAFAYDDSGRFPSQYSANSPHAQAQTTAPAPAERCATKRQAGSRAAKRTRACR